MEDSSLLGMTVCWLLKAYWHLRFIL